jgi:hypothetical protein
MTIYHFHHIIPRHLGGSDDPSNLVRLTVEEHAEAHRKLYEEHRLEEDRLAWLGLSGILSKQEHVKELTRLAGNKTVQLQVGIHNPDLIHLKQLGGRISIKKLHDWGRKSRWMNNGSKDTRVFGSETQTYLDNGWSFGRLFSPNKGKKNLTNKLFWVNKGGKNKRIPEDQVKEYISDGWSSGMFMKF